MARDIAGATLNTNRVTWTLAHTIGGAWSIAVWVYARSTVNAGRFAVSLNSTNNGLQRVAFATGPTAAPQVLQGYTTTNSQCTSGTFLSMNVWSLVVGMFDAAGTMGAANRCHIFQGDVDTAMFQPTETLVAPSGTIRSSVASYRVGNGEAAAPASALDGIVGPHAYWDRLITLAEAEGLRRVWKPPADGLVFEASLTDPTLANVYEETTRTNGTITGAAVAVAADPPIPILPASSQLVGSTVAASMRASTR